MISNHINMSHFRFQTVKMGFYQCEECGTSFPKLSQLLQHRRTENHWRKYTCPSCKKTFNRKDNLDRHLKKHVDDNNQNCPECLKVFTRIDALDHHLHRVHGWEAPTHQASNQEGGGVPKRQKVDERESSSLYTIKTVSERKIEKFKTTATYYKISVNDIEERELSNILKILRKLFQSILDNVTQHIPSTDLVRLSIDNSQLDFPIILPFMRRTDLTVNRVLSEIERVLQSYQEFVLDETFGMELVHVHMPSGSGSKRKPYVNFHRFLDEKKSVLQIRNSDELCCARAIVTAIARIEKHPYWENIRKGFEPQKSMAIDLHRKADIPLNRCGIEDVKRFQAILPAYQIHVLSKEHFNAIIYEGPNEGIPIYLYFHDGHFDVITKVAGFLNRSYFCLTCKKGYTNKENHSCNNPCVYCHMLHEDKSDDWQYCTHCNRYFQNKTCLDMHNLKHDSNQSTCQTYFKCKDCDQTINIKRHKKLHVCHEQYCKTCKDFVSEDHSCYMQPVDDSDEQKKKTPKTLKYIFFDFECTQDDQLECENGYLPDENGKCIQCKKTSCGSFQHQPNLCIAHKVCSHCILNEITPSSSCPSCGKNEHIFRGIQTTNMFCNWLFSEENFGATVICHNFKGYDSYPILQYLHDNAILPEVITNGSKFMSIQVSVCKIRFIDSLNFIPMALSAMPQAFGETEMAKGYFPHLYNRKENQNVILSHLPDIGYYNPDGMPMERRKEFLAWYEINKMNQFDFQEELLKYCRSDVDILRKCCLKFRSMFKDITKKSNSKGIDPFEECITIASACNHVFRKIFLNHESIGIIPPHGYRPEAKQSVMAYQWLAYFAHTHDIHIQHGRNHGEKQIGPYKIDGYYKTKQGIDIALEFHGCFWHGCPHCFSRETVNPVCEMTMAELCARTVEKQQYIEAQGFKYISMWECNFKKESETCRELQEIIKSLDIILPLEPRDAFYGGRTEGFKLYDEAVDLTEINYYDVTSLYPYINKTGKIPLGHPEIITENFRSIDQYEGLVKCKVLAPRRMYIPILPIKCNGKLLFSLCKACAENYQQTTCEHSDMERAFVGTWVTDELKMALSKGYKLIQIYEIWHFTNISQYDQNTKSGGIFTGYVNTFLKIKQEASGWPDWCINEDTKQMYIQQYYEREGIWLDCNKIEENPGMCSLAKLMLNSFWGKFGQRTNLTQTSYVSEPKTFFDFMTSDQQDIKNVRFVNDECVQVDWSYLEDFVEPSSRTNVVIAAYTTAQARLKLYSYLQHLGERTLYCDTDSVIFKTSSKEWKPPLGDFLGDLTDEAPGNSITHFVTGGPKNYAYKLSRPNKKGQQSICKVRGITLIYKNSLVVNYNTIADLVTGKATDMVIQVHNDTKICRDASKTKLLTMSETKDYRIVFDKRVIGNGYITYPYGY